MASSESPRFSRAWASSWAVSGRIARAARVEANGLVATREFFQHLAQLVVDPDITRIPLLGPPQHRLGPGAIAGIVQTGAQQMQADRAQLVEFAVFARA